MDGFGHLDSTGDLHELVTTFDDNDNNDHEQSQAPNLNFSSIEVSSEQFDWSFDNRPGPDASSAGAYQSEPPATLNLPRAEKQDHNPTAPVEGRRPFARGISSSTPSTLTRLFAFQSSNSASSSRTSSYNQSSPKPVAAPAQDASTLPVHLYTRGLLGGRHSDINIHAFGNAYALHRLILDRAPFFASALSEPWLESSAKDVTLHPEEADQNITALSFELALKRLYGSHNPEEEEQEAVALFATGCWLEMDDLVEACVASILRQLGPDTVSSTLKLVENNYYGKHGEKILASAKAVLYRFGWEMPIKNWDGISGTIVREIIGGDAFYVSSEWDRWYLAKRLLDKRLEAAAKKTGDFDQLLEFKSNETNITLLSDARRSPMKSTLAKRCDIAIKEDLRLIIYSNADIEPISLLLENDIHYMHLDFEQLQVIRTACDILNIPVVSGKTIANALWMSMELRQKIVNAEAKQTELNITIYPAELDQGVADLLSCPKSRKISTIRDQDGQTSPQHANEAKSCRHWIPRADGYVVVGGGADPVAKSCDLTPGWNDNSQTRLPSIPKLPTSKAPAAAAYSQFPPFRFAVEFPNPAFLRASGRMYSRSIFYGGSTWNLYIQRIPSSSKQFKFEIYLHRTTDRHLEETSGNPPGLSQRSVDERIGQLEREMILRSEKRFRTSIRPDFAIYDDDSSENAHARTNSISQGESFASTRGSGWLWGLPDHPTTFGSFYNAEDSNGIESDEGDRRPNRAVSPPTLKTSALPPYTDPRPKIKTYFKIYISSKGGRLMALYESVPVPFSSEQSWGWKSSSFMLDDNILLPGSDGLEKRSKDEGEDLNPTSEQPTGRDQKDILEGGSWGTNRKAREQKLRLAVIIGHV